MDRFRPPGRYGARICAGGWGRVRTETRQTTDDDALRFLGDVANVIRIGEGSPEHNALPGIAKGRHHPAGNHPGQSRRMCWAGGCGCGSQGFLTRIMSNWDGVICVIEGDVTHWVHVSAGEIVSFASFLTLRRLSLPC